MLPKIKLNIPIAPTHTRIYPVFLFLLINPWLLRKVIFELHYFVVHSATNFVKLLVEKIANAVKTAKQTN